MAIRIQRQISRRKGGGVAVSESSTRLRRLRSVRIANLDKLRQSMRRASFRFSTPPVIHSDESMESSYSNSPNYMKATRCSNARTGSLKNSPGTSGYSSSTSTAFSSNQSSSRAFRRKSSLSCGPASGKLSGSKSSTPAIKYQKSLKRLSGLKRLWKMPRLKSRSSSRFGDINSAHPEPSIDGAESSSDQLSVSRENAMELNRCNDSEENSNSLLQSDDWEEVDSMIREVLKPQSLEKSRSIKLTKLRSIRFRRRWSKSRLDQDSLSPSSNEVDAKDASTPANPTKMNDQKLLNASAKKSASKPDLAKVPSLPSRRNAMRKRYQASKLAASADRPTCSSNIKRCSSPEHAELPSEACESAETSSNLNVCSYHYCSLHAHHHDHLPLKSLISDKRRSVKSRKGNKQREMMGSRNVSKYEQFGRLVSAKDNVSEETNTSTKLVDATIYADHEDLIAENDQPELKSRVEGTEKSVAKTVDRFVIREDKRSETNSFGASSSVEEEDEKILKEADTDTDSSLNKQLNDNYYRQNLKETVVIVSDSPLTETYSSNEFVGAPSGSVPDELAHATAMSEETRSSSSVSLQYPTEEAVFTKKSDIASDFLSDRRKYTNIWQLIYEQAVSKTEPEGKRQDEEVEASEEQDVDGRNIAEIKESKSHLDKTQELDQIVAIKLVRESISALLQTPVQPSNPVVADPPERVIEKEVQNRTDDICSSDPMESLRIKEDIKKDGDTTVKLHGVRKITENKSNTGQEITKTDEGNVPKKEMSTGFKKLKKVLAYTKFIRAMKNLKTINSRQPKYLFPDLSPEAERIHLRPLRIDERRNTDEWMLDHALRQVISKLDPSELRRVAMLVEAFETVNPEIKEFRRKHSRKNSGLATETASATPISTEEENTVVPDHECSRTSDSSSQEQVDKEMVLAPVVAVHRDNYKVLVSDSRDFEVCDREQTASTIIMANGKEICVASDRHTPRLGIVNAQEPSEDEKFVTSVTMVQNQEEALVAAQEGSTLCDRNRQKSEEKVIASAPMADNKEYQTLNPGHKEPATTACNEEEKFSELVPSDDAAIFKESLQEDDAIDNSSLNKELYDDLASNTFNLHIHNQASREGCPVCHPHRMPEKSKETDSNHENQMLSRSLSTDTSEHDNKTNSREKIDSSHKDKLLSRSASNDSSGHGNKTNILRGILLDQQKCNSMWLLIFQQVQSSSAAEAGEESHEGKEDQTNQAITSFEKVIDSEAVNNDAGYKKLELTQSDAVNLIQDALDGILRQNSSSEPTTPKISDGTVSKGHQVLDSQPAISTSKDTAANIFKAEDTMAENTSPGPEKTYISSDATTKIEQKSGLQEGKSKAKISRAYSKLRKAVLCNKFIKAMETMQKVQKARSLPMEPEDEDKSIRLRPSSTNSTKDVEQWMLDHALQQVIAKLAPAKQRKVALLIDAFEKVNSAANETSTEASRNEPEEMGSPSSVSNLDKTYQSEDGMIESPENFVQPQDHIDCELRTESISSRSEIPEIRDPRTSELLKDEETAAKQGEDGDSEEAKESFETYEDDNSPSSSGKDVLGTPRYSSMWRLIYHHLKSGSETPENKSPHEAHIYGQDDGERSAHGSYQSSEPDEDENVETRSPDSTYTGFREQDAFKLVEQAVNEILQSQDQHDFEKTDKDGEETIISDTKAAEPEDMEPTSEDKTKQDLARSYSNLSKVILCKRFIRAMEKHRKLKPRKGPQYLHGNSSSEPESVRLKNQMINERHCYGDWMLDNALQQVIGKLAPAQKRRVSTLVQAFEAVGPQPGAEIRRKVNITAS